MQPKVKNSLLIGFMIAGVIAVSVILYGDSVFGKNGDEREKNPVNEGPKTVIVTPPTKVRIEQQVSERASVEWIMSRSEHEKLQNKEVELLQSKYNREIAENNAAVSIADLNIESADLDVQQKRKQMQANPERGSTVTNVSSLNRGGVQGYGSGAQMGKSLENNPAGSLVINAPEDKSVINKFNHDGSIIITVSRVTSLATKGSVINGVRIKSINRKKRTATLVGVKSGKTRTIMFNARSTRSYAAQKSSVEDFGSDGDENTDNEAEG